MAYELRAVIGRAAAVATVAVSLSARAVQLTADLELLPVTDGLYERLGPSDVAAEPVGVTYCHSTMARAMEAASIDAPIIYVEVEFYSGRGGQGAVCFDGGRVIWSALPGEIRTRSGRTQASEALHLLGVEAGDAADEFDAVGLGRHRFTQRWLAKPPA